MRRVLILILVALLLAEQAAEVIPLWWDRGDLGISGSSRFSALGGKVSAVTPGGPADRAGVRIGDVFDTADGATRITAGLTRFDGSGILPGRTYRIAFLRNGVRRTVEIVAVRATSTVSTAERVFFAVQIAVTVISVGIAGWLLAARPGPMTFSLLLAVLSFGWNSAAIFRNFPLPAISTGEFFLYVFYLNAGWAALPWFAVRFPDDGVDGRKPLEVISVAWFALNMVPQVILAALTSFAPIDASDAANTFALWDARAQLFSSVLAIAILVFRLKQSAKTDRARTRWVVTGIAIAALANGISDIIYVNALDSELAQVVNIALIVASLALPVSAAYALLRNRLVDTSFLANRAAVYGTMTTLVVLGIGGANFIAGKLLSNTRLAGMTEVAVTLVIGFALNAVQERVTFVVERVFFRRRFAAEAHLNRVGAALAYATHESTIEDAVVNVSAEQLRLASAALFRREGTGNVFVRSSSVGWNDAALAAIDADDALVRFLHVERRSLRLDDARWSSPFAPRGAAAPIVAVPLGRAGQIDAFVLYGAHEDGTDLDTGEVRLLDVLAERAAAAFDHVEAAALRRALAEVEGRLTPAPA